MAVTVIDELVTLLGMDIAPGTNAKVERFKTTITDITTSVGFLSAGIVAATIGFLVFAEQANKSVKDLDNFNKLTGISVNTVQELSFAVQQVGGNASALESDLLSLTKSMSSPIPGEFNHALFMLGVTVKKASGELKSADEVLLDVADKFQTMSEVEQIQWGSKIGISDSTILLLKKGRKEIERLSQEARDLPIIISAKQAQEAKEFVVQVDKLGRILDFLGKTVAASISPALKDMVGIFIGWIGKNKEFVQTGLENTINGIIRGFNDFITVLEKAKDAFFDLFPGIEGILDGLSSMDLTATTVTGALAVVAITLGLLIGKFLLVAGVVVAAGLLFNDFVVYIQDGDSAIGKLINSVEELWQKFNDKFPAIGGILESTGEIFKTIGGVILDGFVNALELAWKGIQQLGNGLGWLIGKFDLLLSSFGLDKFFEDVEQFVKTDPLKRAGVKIGSDFRRYQTEFHKQSVPLSSFSKTLSPSAAVPSSIINNQQNKSSLQKNENNINNVFHITGTEPKEIAGEVTKEMEGLLDRTYPGSLSPLTQ